MRLALIWGLGVFALGQLLVILWIEYVRPDWKDPLFGQKLRQLTNRLEQVPDAECIVLLGSSKVAFGFDGALVEGKMALDMGKPVVAYNLGRLGGGTITAGIYLRRLLAQGIRPNVLVIELVPAWYTPRGWRPEVSGLEAGYLDRSDLACLRQYDQEVESEWHWWVNHTIPAYAYRRVLAGRLAPFTQPRAHRIIHHGWKDLQPSGWVPLHRPESQAHRNRIEEGTRKEWRPYMMSLENDPWSETLPAVRALEETLRLASHERIPVVLTILPEWPGMHDWYPRGAFDRLVEHWRAVAHRHQCRLVNARDWVDEEMFADPVHLDTKGARVFTLRFGREVLHPALEEIHRSREKCDRLAHTPVKRI